MMIVGMVLILAAIAAITVALIQVSLVVGLLVGGVLLFLCGAMAVAEASAPGSTRPVRRR